LASDGAFLLLDADFLAGATVAGAFAVFLAFFVDTISGTATTSLVSIATGCLCLFLVELFLSLREVRRLLLTPSGVTALLIMDSSVATSGPLLSTRFRILLMRFVLVVGADGVVVMVAGVETATDMTFGVSEEEIMPSSMSAFFASRAE
jgi:hypothetical protein